MVDVNKLTGIFRNLDRYLTILRELAQLPKTDLLSDLGRLGGAKYYLQVAVECCVDVANHMIARQNWRAPKSHGDSFVILVENGVIPADFVLTTRQMVGMRNRLVHLYWEVDAETVYETLQSNLADFERFEESVQAYLRRTGAIQE